MSWRASVKKHLPPELRAVLCDLPDEKASFLLEIRLYTGCRPWLVYPWGCEAAGGRLEEADMQDALAALSGYALYRCERQIAEGYMPIAGGHRAGICGRMTQEADGTWRMARVHSICLRICRRVPGAAAALYPWLTDKNRLPRSVLLLGPPGCGKTTLLRDAAEYLADEAGLHVAAADEREELFPFSASDHRIDVLSGCDKAKGMMMLLRTMSPQVVVCDEIGSADDAAAIAEAARCGAAVLASAHAGSCDDIYRRPALRQLFDARTFDLYAILGRMGAVNAVLDADGRKIQGGTDHGQLGYCRHGDDCRSGVRLSAL